MAIKNVSKDAQRRNSLHENVALRVDQRLRQSKLTIDEMAEKCQITSGQLEMMINAEDFLGYTEALQKVSKRCGLKVDEMIRPTRKRFSPGDPGMN